MHLGKPDPRFTSSLKAQRNFKLALKIALTLVGFLWVILIFDLSKSHADVPFVSALENNVNHVENIDSTMVRSR